MISRNFPMKRKKETNGAIARAEVVLFLCFR